MLNPTNRAENFLSEFLEYNIYLEKQSRWFHFMSASESPEKFSENRAKLVTSNYQKQSPWRYDSITELPSESKRVQTTIDLSRSLLD